MKESNHEKHYYEAGGLWYEKWTLNGKSHRVDGPSVISYYKDGTIYCKSWNINDKHHRLDGPSYIRYYKSGSVMYEEWWVNGKKFPKKQFDEEVYKINFNNKIKELIT